MKKNDADNFSVPIVCYNRVEVCELVGTHLLNDLKVAITKENMGLYRDDVLVLLENMLRPEIER